jgi:hypothetical protein
MPTPGCSGEHPGGLIDLGAVYIEQMFYLRILPAEKFSSRTGCGRSAERPGPAFNRDRMDRTWAMLGVEFKLKVAN